MSLKEWHGWGGKSWVGWMAGLGTTFSFLPQVIQMYRAPDFDAVRGISVPMLLVHSGGVTCWVVYGCLQKDVIMTSFNLLSFVMVQLILGRWVYLRFDTRNRRIII
jgi:uncharacterized protein with PQ loop repeat